MHPDDCLYCIFCLLPSSTQAQIKKAYLKLSLKMHPDKHQGDEEAYIRKFQEVSMHCPPRRKG